jgi:acetylglutamate kinase
MLEFIAKDEYIPVVAPIGVDKNGQSYNINADTVAGAIASAIKAEKLMLLTDVEGIKNKNDEVIPVITKEEIKELIEQGTINGGMIPKVLGCFQALEAGVNRTHIIDGRIPHCILLEIFTDRGIGTMITE